MKNNTTVDSPVNSDNTTAITHYYMPFTAKPKAEILISQTENLLCAYSRKPMISPHDIRYIYARLAKRKTAQSAINFLQGYEKYMQPVEADIFNMFKSGIHNTNTTFQDILIQHVPESYKRVKDKQITVLNSANEIIQSLDETTSYYVSEIRDNAINDSYNGTFSRHDVLEQINSIDSGEENIAKLHEIYKLWYKLPSAYSDFDLFILKYAGSPHEAIAQRLISSSVASIEHIVPSARGGEDKLENYALVAKAINNEKGDMLLTEFDELHPDMNVKENLQLYLNDVCTIMQKGCSLLAKEKDYPQGFRDSVSKETNGLLELGLETTEEEILKRSEYTSPRIPGKGYRNDCNRYMYTRKSSGKYGNYK